MNHLRLKEEKVIDDKTIKNARNLFKLTKENEAIKDKIIRDIRNLFELEKEEESYYKPITVSNFLEQQLN